MKKFIIFARENNGELAYVYTPTTRPGEWTVQCAWRWNNDTDRLPIGTRRVWDELPTGVTKAFTRVYEPDMYEDRDGVESDLRRISYYEMPDDFVAPLRSDEMYNLDQRCSW